LGRYKAWMRLDLNRETRFDLQVKKDLLGIEVFAKTPERRPQPAVAGSRPKIAVEHEALVFGAHAQLVVVWIEYLEAILRGLREWNAMPRICQAEEPILDRSGGHLHVLH
jgi:hypothetical protein